MTDAEKKEMAKKLFAIAVAKLHEQMAHRIRHGNGERTKGLLDGVRESDLPKGE